LASRASQWVTARNPCRRHEAVQSCRGHESTSLARPWGHGGPLSRHGWWSSWPAGPRVTGPLWPPVHLNSGCVVFTAPTQARASGSSSSAATWTLGPQWDTGASQGREPRAGGQSRNDSSCAPPLPPGDGHDRDSRRAGEAIGLADQVPPSRMDPGRREMRLVVGRRSWTEATTDFLATSSWAISPFITEGGLDNRPLGHVRPDAPWFPQLGIRPARPPEFSLAPPRYSSTPCWIWDQAGQRDQLNPTRR